MNDIDKLGWTSNARVIGKLKRCDCCHTVLMKQLVKCSLCGGVISLASRASHMIRHETMVGSEPFSMEERAAVRWIIE